MIMQHEDGGYGFPLYAEKEDEEQRPVRDVPQANGCHCSCGGIIDEAGVCNRCTYDYEQQVFIA